MFSGMVNFLKNHEWVFWAIVTVLTAIKVALALQGALAAFKGVMAGVTLVYKSFVLLLGSPLALPAIAIGAALLALWKVRDAAFAAWDAVRNAKNAAEGLSQSNRAILRNLQAQTRAPYSTAVQDRARAQIQALAASGQFDNLASGGPVMAGVPYTVGEQGREMFVPSQNGTIVNANKTKGMTGGGNVTFNVNVGMYAGTEIEKRKMAKAIFDAYKDYLASNNMNFGVSG
jgi:hypothetical protein